MEEYMEYLEEFWFYLPYIIYAYVFLTLLPKSLYRIKKFADEDYEANMLKYHRCYGPDLCCHRLATADGAATPNKVKTRKPVTRIYPKRNSATTDSGYPSTSSHSSENSKRPVQTYTHVNQIARMFEIGGVASSNNNNNNNNNNSSTPMSKKINRVPPTIYPSELKTPMQKSEHLQYFTSKTSSERQQENSPNFVKLRTVPKVQLERRSSAEEFAQMLLSKDLLDLNDIELLASCEQVTSSQTANGQITTTTTNSRLTRRGTSATPSTASPAASCSPMSASPPASPRHLSPTKTIRSSLDDIFAAIAKSAEITETTELFMCSADAEANLLSPVTSIDDILSQRRLSRPLSAYSISDLLLNEENSKTLTTTTATATTEPTQEEEELLNKT